MDDEEMPNANMEIPKLMQVDFIPDNCEPATCNDCKVLLDSKRIRQEKTGICWFASLLHIFNWSDGFRNKKLKKTKRLETALKELKNLANKPCTSDFSKLSLVVNFCAKSVTFHEDGPNNILYEYFSPTGALYCDATATSGGFPTNYLMPYMVTLGYDPTSIKHVVSDLDKVQLLYSGKDNRNPRQTKYMRVLADYLRELMVFKPRGIEESTDVCTLSFLQSNKNFDNPIDRRLALGKYVMFIHGDYIQVFKLDAMILISLNNSKRGSGHAICAVSCNNEGYIINTYDQDDYHTADNNDCGLFEYDWHKWNPDYVFAHSFNDQHQCTSGGMKKISDIAATSVTTVANNNTKDYYYHRNIGDNSFMYVRQADVMVTDKVIHYHGFKQHAEYFSLYVMPYFTFFTNATNIYLTEVTFEYLVSKKDSIRLVADGVGYDPDVSTKENWGYYKLDSSNTNNNKLFLDIVPEDFRIYLDAQSFYILVQYTIDFKQRSYGGGRKAKK